MAQQGPQLRTSPQQGWGLSVPSCHTECSPALADGEACPGLIVVGLDLLPPLPGRAGGAGQRPEMVLLQGSTGTALTQEIQVLKWG